MRSHTVRFLHFVTSGAGLLLLTLALAAASIPAYAQTGIWQIDAQHSIARLSLGSGPRAVEVGVARVSGSVAFDASNPADPLVNLNIEAGKGASYSEISFRSKRSEITKDGKLAFVGDLSMTRVERSATPYVGGGEGYYGAEYGQPVAHTDVREITLVLPSASLPGAQNGTIHLSPATHISRERFPELLSAMAAGNWPNLVVEDEHCTMPATPAGEDYSGPVCSGTPVVTASNSVTTYVGGGEGYYGSERIVIPDGNQATIAFDLKLNQSESAPSAASGPAEAAGN